MAGELKTTLQFECHNPVFSDLANSVHVAEFQIAQLQTDQAAIGEESGVVIVGQAAEEVMPTGDISTLGILVLRNLDADNYVTYGPESGGSMVPFGRLNPRGEPAFIRLEPGITLRWQADTADCKVWMLLLEN